MATKKDRVSVTLWPDDASALRELADLNGSSVSSVIAELVQAAMPTIHQLNATLREAQGAEAEVLRRLAESYAAAGAEVEPEIRRLQARYEGMLGGTQAALRAVREAEGDSTEDPRLVTRGSRDPNPPIPLRRDGSERAAQ